MKKTILEIVQSILASMDSDEVNSINDTPESLQVAGFVVDSYYHIVSRANLPEHYKLFELNAATVSKPTLMTPPDRALNVSWIKYDNKSVTETIPEFVNLTPMEVPDFINMIYEYDTGASYFGSYNHTIGTDTIPVFYYNDRHPSFYTVLQDNSIIFDSYDSSVETNLQKTNTLCYGLVAPSITLADATVPELDADMFPLLENEAKSQAFIELKQTSNPIAEKRARRHWVSSQRNKENIKVGSFYSRLPNYGRK